MSIEKRKYTESHWGVFVLLGIVTFVAGLYLMFSPSEDVAGYITVIGYILMGLAVAQIINVIYRKRRQHSWGIPLAVGAIELGVGLTLVLTSTLSYEFHIALIAGYVLVRSVSSIVSGFASFVNMTDRFMWVAYGMAGSVLGFILLADPGISRVTFIRVFATFMLVAGLTNLMYGVHAKDEIKIAKAAQAEKRALSRGKAKVAAKKGKKARK